MSRIPRSMASKNLNECQPARTRSHSRQFCLMRTQDGCDSGGDLSVTPSAVLNIVMPRNLAGEPCVASSHSNTAAMNIVSKSPFGTNIPDSHEIDMDSQFSVSDSCHVMSDPIINSSSIRCSLAGSNFEQCCVNEERLVASNFEPCCVNEERLVTPVQSNIQCIQSKQHVARLKQHLSNYRTETEGCGDAAKINGQLNEIFVRRLVDIENIANGDIDIKLVTYQEWVDMLIQINELIIRNMADLESEVAERLECMKHRISATSSQTNNNEEKYRQDISSLVQLIQNAYHHDNWETKGLVFLTVNPADILNMKIAPCPDAELSGNIRPCGECGKMNTCALEGDLAQSKEHIDGCEDSQNRFYVNEPGCEMHSVTFHHNDVQRELCICTASANIDKAADVDSCAENEQTNMVPESKPDDTRSDLDGDKSNSYICEIESGNSAYCDNTDGKDNENTCSIPISNQQNTQVNVRALAVEVAAKHDEICALKRQLCSMEEEIQKAQQKIQLKDTIIKGLRNDLKSANSKTGKSFVYDDIYNTTSEPNPFCQAIKQIKQEFEEKERALLNTLAKKCKQIEDLQKGNVGDQDDLRSTQSNNKLGSREDSSRVSVSTQQRSKHDFRNQQYQ